jgi:PAS domain-containing protein
MAPWTRDLVRLRAARDGTGIGAVLIEAFARVLRQRDEVVVTAFTDGRFEVLAASRPGASALSGAITDHPVLAGLDDLQARAVFRPGDPALRSDLTELLKVAGVRELVYEPLVSLSEVLGCVIVLRRARRRLRTDRLQPILELAAAALHRLHLERALSSAAQRDQAATEVAALLVAAMRTIDASPTVEDVVGNLLRAAAGIVDELIGAIIGQVSGGVVTAVSPIGTTPRSAVHALQGTRLDGFPIGRELETKPGPIFTDLAGASHATRSRIMEPIGARSLIAAAGRDGGDVRVVLSAYRAREEQLSAWQLSAVEALLDHAAQVLGRLKREERLEQVGAATDDAIVVYDQIGGKIYENAAAREILGADPVPAYQTLSGDELEARAHPLRRALAGEQVRDLLFRSAATGRAHRIRALPLAAGGAVLTARDVTEEIQADAPDAEVSDLSEHRTRRAP